jgi:hypothetical protein
LPVSRRTQSGFNRAIACDLVASNGEAKQEELSVVELLRHRLSIDRLIAAAIERAASARFRTL